MQAESASGPDWRDAAAYAPLLDADRSLFAWEWLRRNPRYRDAAFKTLATASRDVRLGAADFGLVAFECPNRSVPNARPMWSAHVHPYVLAAEAGGRARPTDLFDPDRMAALRVVAGGLEHLLLSDGLRMIRLDAPSGTFASGPVSLRYRLEGIAAAERPLLALRRFLAICRRGQFSRSLHRRELSARRWILMLRANDALTAGADQREIAQELLSRTATEPGWRSREPSVRSQAQRLVRSARALSGGEYRALLR